MLVPSHLDVVLIRSRSELAALNARQSRYALLLEDSTELDQATLDALVAMLDAQPHWSAVCPLRAADVRASLEHEWPLSDIKRALFWAQERVSVRIAKIDLGCTLFRVAADTVELRRVNSLCVDGLPASAADLTLLTAQLLELEDVSALPQIDDRRPLDLHISHAWGGGSERFVADFCAAQTDRLSLLLQSNSDSATRIHGGHFSLRLGGPHGPIVRSWQMPEAIESVAVSHPGYLELLASIAHDFAISRVLVSSLIGHSLDALRTAWPTTVVLHDYFPAWPLLDVQFAQRELFDASALSTALADKRQASPFRAQSLEAWMALRAAYFAALRRADLQRVAPSQSVVDNLRRLGFDGYPISVIAHGIAPLIRVDCAPSAGLTVLVLGRIAGGKGEELLASLVEHLAPQLRLMLLGAGSAAERFRGCNGVDIITNYRYADLSKLVALIRPNVALLPSLVAETFSYTLSELNSLGVPTIVTQRGSFCERIKHAQNGFLVAPAAAAIAELLVQFLTDTKPLETVRGNLLAQPIRSIQDMLHDYASVLVSGTPEAVNPQHELTLERAQMLSLTHKKAEVMRAHALALGELAARDTELLARAEWGHRLQREFAERSNWAKTLEDELRTTQGNFKALTEEFDERTTWALERNQRANELEGEMTRVVADSNEAREQLSAREAALEARFADLAVQTEEMKATFTDFGQMHRVLSWQPYLQLIYRGRGLRLRLEFALKRAVNAWHRARISVATRGLSATAAKLIDTLRARRAVVVRPQALQLISLNDFEFKPFAVGCSDAPQVSIVVPVYNKYPYTDACLRALDGAKGRIGFEVIVIDDCSSDATAENLAQVAGVRYLRNDSNLGFIGSCNRAAGAARGEFVVMLNNDTQVQPGWLEALIDTFAAFPECGMSGAKLVYPDGRLQEAGGVIFADGSGWNYGRLEDPADPRFNYPREVDYLSGAAICLRRSQWEAFAGFDERYKPAYYEDTDMAFRVREAGLKVIYQPRAVVVHFEGISSGTDLTSGIKRFQLINQVKFKERWKDALKAQPLPRGHEIIDSAREHRVAGRVLIIDATTPTPDQDSGSVRMLNLMRLLLNRRYKVSFFADNRAFVAGYSQALQDLGVEVWAHPYLADVEAFFERYGKLYDVIILSRHYVASLYIDFVRRYAPKAKLVFDTVDLHYLREERQAALEGSASIREQAAHTRRAELEVMARCDLTVVVSPAECIELKASTPSTQVAILSNVVESKGCRRPFQERSDIWFIGGFQHTPNVDAMRFFAGSVMPLLNRSAPQLKLHIVGSKMPDEIRQMARPSVLVHGQLADVEPYLDGCLALVAPLRFGAGVKGKINMAMAYGQPVISTALGVEGMYLEAQREVLIAESAADFEAAVLNLMSNSALWAQLSRAGLANVDKHFSFAAADLALSEILKPRNLS